MSSNGRIESSSPQSSSRVNVGVVSGVRIHAEQLAARLAIDGAYRILALHVNDFTRAQAVSMDLHALVVDSSSVQPHTLVPMVEVNESVTVARVAVKLIAYGLGGG